jgi:hypothetical protein
MYSHSQQVIQEYKLMTADGTYNAQNKAHRNRILGYSETKTKKLSHAEYTARQKWLTLSLRRPFKFKIPHAGSFKNLTKIAE